MGLEQRFQEVTAVTEHLTAPLSAEDQMLQSMEDASPAKWHLGHTSWFFDRFALRRTAHDALFNSYYDGIPGPRCPRGARGLLSRPSIAQVRAYRREVHDGVLARLRGRGAAAADAERAWRGTVVLGINHEQQHQELILTDIKHAFWMSPTRPRYRERAAGSDAAAEHPQAAPGPLAWHGFTEATVAIGREAGGSGEDAGAGVDFAYDNEGPCHRVLSAAFALADRAISCGEFAAFVRDGGYRRPELWLALGWEAVQAGGWNAPLYWYEHADTWWHFTLDGPRPLDAAEPVCHVSYYEADAFARWAGARLPTEIEWERAAGAVAVAGNFLESGRLHPAPASAPTPTPTPRDGGGVRQLFGDVWEWTASPYVPYPGFHPPAGALGEYNAKFMCNQMVLRGGSCATPRAHARASYRNFWPPHTRWQFSGIRLARDA